MNYGVCIVALGYEIYGQMAFNLAMSLRASDPDISITLFHDGSSIKTLDKKQKAFFDNLILTPEEYYTVGETKQYQKMKIHVFELSPYDMTLYIDADTIWIPERRVSWLIGEMMKRPFVIGTSGHYDVSKKKSTHVGYTYWGEPETIVKKYGLTGYLPQTQSGVFFFNKTSDKAKEIFELALEVYDDPKAPCIKWANGKPDEFCFNVAMSKLDYVNMKIPYYPTYFRTVNGYMKPDKIFSKYWGIAVGGSSVETWLVRLYNRLVDRLSVRFQMTKKFYFVQKKDVIPEREKF